MAELKFTGINTLDFSRAFSSDEDCYKYIASIKWTDNFICKKCGNTRWCKGRKPHSRRCTRCKYDESPTSGTMFNKCKLPLLTAFQIAFKISTKSKGISSLELHNELGLRQKTCWNFKCKIQQAMGYSSFELLEGEVYVDNFIIGESPENQKEVSRKNQKLVILAVNKTKNGINRAFAQVIERASADNFKPFFTKYISPVAHIITSEHSDYLPLKKNYLYFKQIPSNQGSNFSELQNHIINLTGWLKQIHRHCSNDYLQGYIDEYHFRYNRRNSLSTIFHELIESMIKNEPNRLAT